MDVKWIVDEQINAVANGGCKLAATNGRHPQQYAYGGI